MKSLRTAYLLLILLAAGVIGGGLMQVFLFSPIKIGLAAELTGKQNELGVTMRNGAILAVEEINASAGFFGRKIKLQVEDDLGTPEGARQADRRLIAAGVTAIVGHATSGQTVTGYEITEPAKMILFSPLAAAGELTGKDDHFFRIIPTAEYMGQMFARYVYQQKNIRSIAILYDEDNAAYSAGFAKSFAASFQDSGGTISMQQPFSANGSPNYDTLIKNIKTSNSQGVFIITSSATAALITQHISLNKWTPALFGAPWTYGEDLIRNGGQTVEGMEVLLPYSLDNSGLDMDRFQKQYSARFSSPPTFASIFGYEGMHVLAETIKNSSDNPDRLLAALKKPRQYKGVTSPIILDTFGDASRNLYVFKIAKQQYISQASISITP